VLGEGSPADLRLAALKEGVVGGGMAIVPASEVGERWDSAISSQPLLAIGYRLPRNEQYLVALFQWQSLQRTIGTLSGDNQPEVTTSVSLATRSEGFGFWVFEFGETRSGRGVEQGVEQALPYGAPGTGSDTASGRGAGLYTNLAGVPVLGAYRWNPRLQVAVVAEQPQADVLAAGNTLTALIVAITLGMALVTAAIAAFVTRQVTRPIVQLTETAARMARGDLDQRVAVTRQDEIGVLARAFNHMAAELRVLYADLNARVELLANMSHALRTPLTSIIGFSRLMSKEMDGPLTELQRTDLAAIHEGGQQLLELINDMLELSDLELETTPMTIDEVDVRGIVDGVIATARALTLNKPVELFQKVASNLPTLYTDGRRVRRVLLVLMSNAVRITDEGTIRLSATAGDGWVTFGIEALGARRQAEIFDKSPGPPGTENGDQPTEESFGHSGLGLTISRQTVEKLGGWIRVESNNGGRQAASSIRHEGLAPIGGEGGATTFTFTLPISPSDRAQTNHTVVADNDV
jgi:signal transduction histidine kinase